MTLATSPAKRALVIDDDESTCDHVRSVLRKLDFQVEIAFDGLEALRLCQAAEYTLIICDIRMPRLSGLSFLSHLANTPNVGAKVVVVSALDDMNIRQSALSAGASAYLVKPLVAETLLAAIAEPRIEKL